MPLLHRLHGDTAGDPAAHLEAQARDRLPAGESWQQHTLDHTLPLVLADVDTQMPAAMSIHNQEPTTG